MYAKLAKSNAKKSIKDYLIYFITITICVSLFYAITSLSSSSYELITEESYNFKALNLILKYSTYIITAILILLVAYVNKYMIKRRKREFATYVLLGAEQKSVALMFFIETIVIGVLAIISGIFVGTLFSQVITAIVLISAQQEVVLNLRLYMDTVLITFIFFIAIFCIIGVYNVIVLRKIKLIDMLNAHKQVEFKFKRSGKVYSAIFVVSIILYVICGSCTIKLMNSKIDYSVRMLMYIGISLITFILGTYALFYSIAYIMIYIKNKRINFKYEGTNLFLIGSIVSKIKTAPVLMATISMTFLGAMISFIITLVMAQWALGYLNMRVPYDIDIRNNYSTSFLEQANISDFKELPKLDYSMVVEYLNDSGYEVKNYCEVEKYILEPDGSNEQLLAISLSDFNKLRNMLGYEEVKLEDNEFATQWYSTVTDEVISNYLDNNYELNINGQTYNINENLVYKDSIGEGFYLNTDNIIILSDKACEGLEFAEINFLANIKDKMSYEDANDFQYNYVYDWFRKDNAEFIKKYSKEYDISYSIIRTRIKSLETNNILVTTLAMRILGIYLGVVLLMISLTVLSLSQLTDSIEHKDRFNILRKLGVEDKEVNKIILKQISIYFIVPIFIAMIGVAIFIYNFYIFYKDIITVFVGDGTFILSIIFGMALMLCVYICYFGGTYYTFKRNINT
ncbi:FtsX-like permease family protein [Clostridium sp.]|uniref:FtsX-like permease family protein n=1 Tax=Clostridium sp. TaxID=1506 RepID=UPI0025EA19FD|nr:FtsX-like permease family protein [uncultured Clostridium sp.]MDU4882459.1 FtsX-like permease family protein [Clostridium celatum]MDU7075835.1 FtsX-like permease family protein [Clostridium celatum]